MMLARHAPQGVTLKHYQDFTVFDLWRETGKLHPIRWEVTGNETARATGTDGTAPHAESAVARRVALTGC